ncbi:hypothetical protein RI129_009693 [Pyrocoelia pectoralis]|uniref:39S ribosomal protein L12, mitochondrial n=1 Tax=Pyrocoelia pectoralis TaxID=417401 RepID=A0AAN7V9T7_9COLE
MIESITIPPPSNIDKPLSPKIEQLVNAISNLTLIEVSELSGGLKKRLNLPDAPMLPVGFTPGAAAPVEDDEEEVAQKVKSSYTVKLMKFDEKQKVPLIKEVKVQMEGMNLVQAKKFVESAPAVLKSDISKEEAEKLKEVLTKVGAEIVID